jgi:hypothetical protein
MKLFMHSLKEDARDWYRGLPNGTIVSCEEFKRVFREKYVDKTKNIFMLNEFNNITKGHNEMVTNFNIRFQKAVNRLPLDLRMNDRDTLLLIKMN